MSEISLELDLDVEISLDDLKKPVEEKKPLFHIPTWHAQARVLVIERTTCQCGLIYEAPGAKSLLVRFVNLRNLDTQELRDHPSVTNEKLPLATRFLVKQVQVCKECAK